MKGVFFFYLESAILCTFISFFFFKASTFILAKQARGCSFDMKKKQPGASKMNKT